MAVVGSAGGVAARLVLTAGGAALLAVAAFEHWTRDIAGLDMNWRAVYQDTFSRTPDSLLTAGAAAIGLGMLALVGLIDATGWLTRIAGLAALAGFVAFIVQVQRSSDHTLHLGTWLGIGGAVACLVAGFADGRARRAAGAHSAGVARGDEGTDTSEDTRVLHGAAGVGNGDASEESAATAGDE